MKMITSVTLAMLLVVSSVGCQSRKTNAKPANVSDNSQLKQVPIEKWGVQSVSFPKTGEMEAPQTSEDKNKDVTWTTYEVAWKDVSRRSEILFSVRTWNVDWPKVADLSAELATPENLMAAENSRSLEQKNSGELEDASAMEVGGLKGNFFRGKQGDDKDRIMTGWYTYRYYQNHAQKINIVAIGPRSELPTYMQVIQSIAFQK